MTQSLTLDDLGMLLLSKTRDAYDDLRETESAHPRLDSRWEREGYYSWLEAYRERDTAFFDLAIEFTGYVWMLEASDSIHHTHHLSFHHTLTAETMALFDILREHVEGDGTGSLATAYLKETVIPAVFAQVMQGDIHHPNP